jgi:hypothetical protein
MTENEYRAMIDQLIQACYTLRDCWIERSAMDITDDPYVEDALSAVESIRAELAVYDEQQRIELGLRA